MATKCRICHVNEREWMFQPWGPGEVASFTFPGHHYRGFDVVPVCDACKQRIEAGEQVEFRQKRDGKLTRYEVNPRTWGSGGRLYWVREPGTLEPGGTHALLIEEDPYWDVVMCGAAPETPEREWHRLGANDTTIGDLCVDCLRAIVNHDEWSARMRQTHHAWPV